MDINDLRLLAPGTPTTTCHRASRPSREAGEPVPATPVEVTRCILDSLAVAYRRHVRLAATLAGRPVEVVHVVGGGTRNEPCPS